MARMEAKVKDIPNIVSMHLKKDRINVRRKVFNDEDKSEKSRSSASSNEGDNTENGSRSDGRSTKVFPIVLIL